MSDEAIAAGAASPFSRHLYLLALLWPVWWILGVDQFILPVFLGLELAREILVRRGRLIVNGPCITAFLLAAWWGIPVFWVDSGNLAIFFKGLVTAWCQVFMLLLVTNAARRPVERELLIKVLTALGAWIALGTMLYVSGLWRGEISTLLGLVLPEQLRQGSEFWSSISRRSLGHGVLWQGVDYRISSIALNVSALSMLSLLLLPLATWRLTRLRRWHAVAGAAVLLALFVGLMASRSRTARLALLAGLVFGLGCLVLRRFSPGLRGLALATIPALAALAVSYSFDDLRSAFETRFVEERRESWWVRSEVYQETLIYFREHPIAGWGQQVAIPGLRKIYSAGSHSSYLGMLFQHGIVGLLLYLSLLVTIWKRVLRNLGLWGRARPSPQLGFWLAVAVGLMSFNVREIADSWWWDHLVTLSVWSVWGLAMTTDRESLDEQT